MKSNDLVGSRGIFITGGILKDEENVEVTEMCIGDGGFSTAFYQLIVENGTGDGMYEKGTLVEITTDNFQGKIFDYWEVAEEYSSNLSVNETDKTKAVFTMPEANVTVTARFGINIGSAIWTVDPVTYTGSPIVPSYVVKIGETTLTEDTDYTITFPKDMTSAGEKTITCTVCGVIKTEAVPKKENEKTDIVPDNTNPAPGNTNPTPENTNSAPGNTNPTPDNTNSSQESSNSSVEETTFEGAQFTVSDGQKTITTANTDKVDVKGSSFANLRLKATGKNKSVKLTWKRVKGADGYIIYGARCGSTLKEITTIKKASTVRYTHKKLKKAQYYKYIVMAYKQINGENYVIATSKSVHAVTNGGKYGNPTKVTVKDSKMSIKKGNKKTIKASIKLPKNKKNRTHIAKFRYESSNTKIATVSKKGVVTGKKKGSAYIYVYAQNGVYKRIKVNVK